MKKFDLGDEGLIPLELRFHHNPKSSHGFVAAALSSTVWHWSLDSKNEWNVEKIIKIDPINIEGWPMPVPSLITDILVSMDDKFIYFANWFHGDIRQYDISDPSNPKLTGIFQETKEAYIILIVFFSRSSLVRWFDWKRIVS